VASLRYNSGPDIERLLSFISGSPFGLRQRLPKCPIDTEEMDLLNVHTYPKVRGNGNYSDLRRVQGVSLLQDNLREFFSAYPGLVQFLMGNATRPLFPYQYRNFDIKLLYKYWSDYGGWAREAESYVQNGWLVGRRNAYYEKGGGITFPSMVIADWCADDATYQRTQRINFAISVILPTICIPVCYPTPLGSPDENPWVELLWQSFEYIAEVRIPETPEHYVDRWRLLCHMFMRQHLLPAWHVGVPGPFSRKGQRYDDLAVLEWANNYDPVVMSKGLLHVALWLYEATPSNPLLRWAAALDAVAGEIVEEHISLSDPWGSWHYELG